MRINQFVLTAFAGAGLYFLYRYWENNSAHLSSRVREKLPVEKDLKTIPDYAGNYDMDGASFDSEGVIIGSDDNKHLDPMKLH